MPPPPRKFWTQCEGGWGTTSCQTTTKLDKPAKWRCDSCIKKYGALKPPRPTAPYP